MMRISKMTVHCHIGSLIITRAADKGQNLPFALTVIFLLLPLPLPAQDKTIPLLISEHHADHMEFFFRHGGNNSTMIVLDAHADTRANEQNSLIRKLAAAGDFSRFDELAGNHNWIQPLVPAPLERLVWISTIRGRPRNDKLEGFNRSITAWDSHIRASYLSIEELRFTEISGETLFVSVDLDFFYSENHLPLDLPLVLDALFSSAARWRGPSVWAICLSRPWLPDDNYAWTLLDYCLNWLHSRPEFKVPEITLFNSRRIDSSRTAQAFHAEGREIPALREKDAPVHIKCLFDKILSR
jgi:hypothetical protein